MFLLFTARVTGIVVGPYLTISIGCKFAVSTPVFGESGNSSSPLQCLSQWSGELFCVW